MPLFQIVFLVVDGVLLVLCPAAVRLGWVTLRAGVVWAATCLSAGVAVLWPRLTLDLAKLVEQDFNALSSLEPAMRNEQGRFRFDRDNGRQGEGANEGLRRLITFDGATGGDGLRFSGE